MSQLSKQDLKAENQLQFPNNNNGAITPADLRAFNVDMIDSTVNQTAFDSFSGSVAGQFASATGSVTSAITASSLITASFNNGTRNLTFTKGDASTFAVNIPGVSGSTFNTGSFATTGSNSFVGNQTIVGNITLPSSSFISTTNTSGALYLSSLNGGFIGLNTDGGEGDVLVGYTGWDGKLKVRGDIELTGALNQSGTFYPDVVDWISSSIQSGTGSYILTTDNNGVTQYDNFQNIAAALQPYIQTGSGSIATGSFATTGSNTFQGNQIIDGGNSLQIIGGNGITLAQNLQGSGSQYSGVNIYADTLNNPNDIYEAFQILIPETGQGIIQVAANSYTPEVGYGNGTVGWIGAGGNNTNGSNTAMIFRPSSALMEVYKPTSFAYNVNITGSLTASLQQGYTWVGNANGKTTLVATSSFGGGGSINTGSFATTGSNTFTGNQIISEGNGLALVGGGGITLSQNLQGSGSQYASVTIFADPNGFGADLYEGFQVLDSVTQGGIIQMAANSYTSYYPETVGWFGGGGNNVDGNNTAFIMRTGSANLEVFKPTKFNYEVYIQSGSHLPSSTGSAVLTWDATTGQVKKASYGQILSASLDVGAFQTNITKSGSAGVSQSISFEVTDISKGVTMQNNSQITLAQAGTYLILFSAQLDCSTGADTIWIWLKKNGTNVPESNTKARMPNNTSQTMTVNFMVEGNAGDYFELAWQNNAGHGQLFAENASGNYPAIPSVILTVNQVH